MTTDEIKKLGEDTFKQMEVSVQSLLVSSEQVVVQTAMDWLVKSKSRFTTTMTIILSGEFKGNDSLQFFLNRMDDEKNILYGIFLYLAVIAKGDIESIANNVQAILLKSATDFLNTVTVS